MGVLELRNKTGPRVHRRIKTYSFHPPPKRKRIWGTLRTEEKLSAWSISEKWRLHWFQSHSADVLLLLLLMLQRKGRLLEILVILGMGLGKIDPTTTLGFKSFFGDQKSTARWCLQRRRWNGGAFWAHHAFAKAISSSSSSVFFLGVWFLGEFVWMEIVGKYKQQIRRGGGRGYRQVLE